MLHQYKRDAFAPIETMAEYNDVDLCHTQHKWEKIQTFYDVDYRHWLPTVETLDSKFRRSYERYKADARGAIRMHIGSWTRKTKVDGEK